MGFRSGWGVGLMESRFNDVALINVNGQFDEFHNRMQSPHPARRPGSLSGAVFGLGSDELPVGYGREAWALGTGELGWVLDAPAGLAFVPVLKTDRVANAEQIVRAGAAPMVMSLDHLWLSAVKQQEPPALPDGTVGAVPTDCPRRGASAGRPPTGPSSTMRTRTRKSSRGKPARIPAG